MRIPKLLLCLFCAFCLVSFLPGMAASAHEWGTEEDLYEKSGAAGLYDSLDVDTKSLLSQAGVQSGQAGDSLSWEGLFRAFSQILRDRLTGPLKALAAITVVTVLCRLANCFDPGGAGGAVSLTGTLVGAAVVAAPLLELMETAGRAVESACVFLLSAVPVYAALITASGSPAAGTSYSFLTLAAGSAIPILCTAVIFPVLHMFLALALVSSVSQVKLGRLGSSLYGFAKWLLVLAVTAFSGILSVQTALNAQVDAAANKAAKLVVSSAVPIVGGAFGDAVAAIYNSVRVVKSGVGAFGILAALCIFAPVTVEAVLWTAVCAGGQIAADLFEAPKISSFLSMCGSVSRMILAVIASTCAVCVVSAAIILFVKGAG